MRFYRWQNGLKQKEIAEALGVAPYKVSAWERGYQRIEPEYWQPLSKLLNWPVEHIKTFTDPWNALSASSPTEE